ncbi:uncharacterized protein A1O5_00914 [Cladophialophora psammophila CBS 110553]|uniref:Uncharacterized protein n=1 Tax=Cladophialophora psammophila CBS 110553 TaxID=1182543 RepID=W9XHK0_9EURO|nr:uncharacterized protein A1O5_00914 [Cladophialophora psammophila CBS 110553]EXJ76406.1 hypothetical protein A1O5_00914 [Cladophialophora psammophila CBS 110553]
MGLLADTLEPGPIVRVTPTVVAVTGENPIRSIYGGVRPFAKDARLADLFSMCRPEHPNVAGIQEAQAAMKRRRLISTAFSTKFLNDNESIFADVARSLVSKIDKVLATGSRTVDIMHVYRYCATEVIGEIIPFVLF